MAKDIKQSTEPKTQRKGNSPYFNLEEEKAFFEEVDEEVRNEKFKKLIQKYGGVLLTILILALSFVVGYEKIGEWQMRRAEQKNVQYVQALTPAADFEQNIVELENIAATEKGLYKDMARLQIANILLDNNKSERAFETLQQLYGDKNASAKIREIAAIKLATYRIDTAPYAEIEDLLSIVTDNEKSAWINMARELLAMSAIQNHDFAKAKSIYQDLLTNNSISDEFRARINDMLASINDAENIER